MSEKVMITEDDFSIEEVIQRVRSTKDGCVLTFLGTVRADPGVESLDIEDYREMALKQLEGIRSRALEEFDVNDIAVIHRVGRLKVGQNITIIAVASAHRDPAFKAARFMIEELKAKTPIWKH
jgi:molybdopterin synthase catalytic subunit